MGHPTLSDLQDQTVRDLLSLARGLREGEFEGGSLGRGGGTELARIESFPSDLSWNHPFT
ncbi:hypothetical protein SCLCIDRAFT_1216216 [Scleroderma citrinum Foug A]|uniref:Uncharacterized protein n=1 Tax=Scleroderma citrinum Foug A TaxID=1036808 RepID=A0A0C3DKS1_9AGAM|nr:hypothetical protein SCLCIDRAFT_1216216 [Scleroderma citrinum Foug A]